jgi:alanyl-tRNA synthetase
MSKTIKLYNRDSYLKEFEARVINFENTNVELDRTAFYPEGGGQVGDTGLIGGVKVVDTQSVEERIIHIMDSIPSFGIGKLVKCCLDWDRRYQIMKLHSAAHIMEHFLYEKLGNLDRVGSRVDNVKDRSDYAYKGRLPVEILNRTEEAANKFIVEGHEIEIKLDPLKPGIRIWRCGPIEMLCGGTHILNTREIGSIRLKRRNPGRGVERVETTLIIN